MKTMLRLSLFALLLAGTQAWGQANLRPDPTPRVPPQPGQGLPLEDLRYLSRALNLSEAQIESGRLAAEKSTNPAVREFGQALAADHEAIRQSLFKLAEQSKANVAAHPSKAWWQGQVQRLRGLGGAEFDREFLNWELQNHLALVNLYQTEASNSPDTELAKFAITTLVRIKQRFDAAQRLGAEYGLSVNVVKQPPQY